MESEISESLFCLQFLLVKLWALVCVAQLQTWLVLGYVDPSTHISESMK